MVSKLPPTRIRGDETEATTNFLNTALRSIYPGETKAIDTKLSDLGLTFAHRLTVLVRNTRKVDHGVLRGLLESDAEGEALAARINSLIYVGQMLAKNKSSTILGEGVLTDLNKAFDGIEGVIDYSDDDVAPDFLAQVIAVMKLRESGQYGHVREYGSNYESHIYGDETKMSLSNDLRDILKTDPSRAEVVVNVIVEHRVSPESIDRLKDILGLGLSTRASQGVL